MPRASHPSPPAFPLLTGLPRKQPTPAAGVASCAWRAHVTSAPAPSLVRRAPVAVLQPHPLPRLLGSVVGQVLRGASSAQQRHPRGVRQRSRRVSVQRRGAESAHRRRHEEPARVERPSRGVAAALHGGGVALQRGGGPAGPSGDRQRVHSDEFTGQNRHAAPRCTPLASGPPDSFPLPASTPSRRRVRLRDCTSW